MFRSIAACCIRAFRKFFARHPRSTRSISGLRKTTASSTTWTTACSWAAASAPLKLWYVFRYYGREGVIALLREALRLAQLLKTLVESDSNFELSAPVPLSLVCFRHRAGDDFNRRLLAEINASGKAFLSHTVLNGKFVLRFAIGNFQTNEADILDTWKLIQKTSEKLRV